jgi:hypothetical protein
MFARDSYPRLKLGSRTDPTRPKQRPVERKPLQQRQR